MKASHSSVAPKVEGTGQVAKNEQAEVKQLDVLAMAQFRQALGLMKDRRYSTADTLLEKVEKRYPKAWGIQLNRAIIAEQLGKVEIAMKRYRTLLAHKSSAAVASTNLSNLLVGKGRFAEASKVLANALRLAPSNADGWFNLAVVKELYLQDLRGAIEAYEQFLALRPEDQAIANRIKALHSALKKGN